MYDEGLFDAGVKFMGPDGILSPALIEQVGGADILEGNTLFTFPSLLPNLLTNDAGVRFYNDYVETFGEEPDPYSVYAYASMEVTLAAIEAAAAMEGGVTREAVLEYIRSSEGFTGILGEFGFDENGDNTKAAFFGYEFAEGNFANPVSVTPAMQMECAIPE
jgi:branched-chain amino acid transport system substrate-binding protein